MSHSYRIVLDNRKHHRSGYDVDRTVRGIILSKPAPTGTTKRALNRGKVAVGVGPWPGIREPILAFFSRVLLGYGGVGVWDRVMGGVGCSKTSPDIRNGFPTRDTRSPGGAP